jgi:hypothetical protein
MYWAYFYFSSYHDNTLLGYNNADENMSYLFINMCSTRLLFEFFHYINRSLSRSNSVSVHIFKASSNKINKSWRWDFWYILGVAMLVRVLVRSTNASDLNSESTRFKSRSEHWLSLQIFRGFPPVPLGKCRNSTSVRPRNFKIQCPSYHSTLYILVTEITYNKTLW